MTTEIYKPTEEEIKEILANHKLWLEGNNTGKRANLESANLVRANLYGANLERANLESANLDFSVFPLWCGSRGIITDAKLVYQLLAHVYALDCGNEDFKKIQELIKPFAEKSHRWKDLTKDLKI